MPIMLSFLESRWHFVEGAAGTVGSRMVLAGSQTPERYRYLAGLMKSGSLLRFKHFVTPDPRPQTQNTAPTTLLPHLTPALWMKGPSVPFWRFAMASGLQCCRPPRRGFRVLRFGVSGVVEDLGH